VTVQRLVTGRSRLLLVGAGHAHLEILRRLAREPPGVELTVVSPAPLHHYSGMVPGFLQGTYSEEEIAVDVPRLAARSGGRFLAGTAVALDPARRAVHLAGGEEVTYDLVSFAVGSDTAGVEDPAVAGSVQRIKPLARVTRLRERLFDLAGGGPQPVEGAEGADGADRAGAAAERRVAVVGGGAAGVEVACAAEKVLASFGPGGRVMIVEAGADILSGYTARCRRRARDILAARGIAVKTASPVAAVRADAVEIAGGGEIASDLTIWLTGAVALPLFQGSGLPLDARGFLLVDGALRSLADPRVFAAGDCGTLADHPDTPKAGVYAVREGPVLWQSLKAALEGGPAPSYRPQKGFLSLLNTADGRALLEYKGLVSHSRWAWRLKDAIDRRFLARYR